MEGVWQGGGGLLAGRMSDSNSRGEKSVEVKDGCFDIGYAPPAFIQQLNL